MHASDVFFDGGAGGQRGDGDRAALPPRPAGRGPKQTVSVDAVVAAAVSLADRDGYAKVSIRTVAADLPAPTP